jgi:hypothetical protein
MSVEKDVGKAKDIYKMGCEELGVMESCFALANLHLTQKGTQYCGYFDLQVWDTERWYWGSLIVTLESWKQKLNFPFLFKIIDQHFSSCSKITSPNLHNSLNIPCERRDAKLYI